MWERALPLVRVCLSRPQSCRELLSQRISFAQGVARRPLSSQPRSARAGLVKLFKKHPVVTPLAFSFIAFGAGTLLYSTYVYITYVAPINHSFPEPVANKLRRALYFSNVDVQPRRAVKYYRQALELAAEHGVNPFSDEVLGIKMTFAKLVEDLDQIPKAIEVIELVRADCQRWIDWSTAAIEATTITANDLAAATPAASENDAQDKPFLHTATGSAMAGAEVKPSEENPQSPQDALKALLGQRTRVLKKMVGMSVKLGDLYATEQVADLASAERNYTEAVELGLRELSRRQRDGVRDGEGEWLSSEEIGGSLEALANHHESVSNYTLAVPLYLHAVTLSPRSCHQVVLMNNLSASLAQCPASKTDPAAPTRAALIDSARSWAEKARAISHELQPPLRTEECDVGCAVATHNLGEFAEMEHRLEAAQNFYQDAAKQAEAAGFIAGVEQAQQGLRRLAAK